MCVADIKKINILKIYNQYLKNNFHSPVIVKIIKKDCTIIFKSNNVYYLLYLEYDVENSIREAVHQCLSKIYFIASDKISLFPKPKYNELSKYGYFYIFELPFKSNFKPISEKNIFNPKDFLIKKIIKNKNLRCRYSDKITEFIRETDNFYIRWNKLPNYSVFKKCDDDEKFYIFETLNSSQIYEDEFNNLCFIDINSVFPTEKRISFIHLKK